MIKKKFLLNFVGTLAVAGAIIAGAVFSSAFSLKGDIVGTNDHNNVVDRIKEANAPDDIGTDLSTVDTYLKGAVKAATRTGVCQSYDFKLTYDGADDYILGLYGKKGTDQYKPLTFVYDVVKADGSTESRSDVLEQKHTNGTSVIFDGIGPEIADPTVTSSADLFVSSEEEVVFNSLKITNIFKAIKDPTKGWIPDSQYPTYYLKGLKADATLSINNYNLNDFLQTKLKKVYTFQGYTCLEVSFVNNTFEQYKKIYKNYENYAEKIASGLNEFKARITNLPIGYYQVNYKDGTSEKISISGSEFLRLDSASGGYRFLLKDVEASKVKSVYLDGVTLYLAIYPKDSFSPVKVTVKNPRCGAIDFRLDDLAAEPEVVDYNMVLVISSIVYLFVFILADIGLFFYLSNKYKNDEFNRVDSRRYRKSSIVAFFGLFVILLDFLVILFRATGLNNTIKVHNPIDAYIVIISVVTIIYIGYYIKTFITAIKNHREKVKADKLKLDETKVDDGTMMVAEK